MSDVTVDIEHLVESEHEVAVHLVLHATNGGVAGHPPTGTRASAWGVEFWRFEGDQVVERWVGANYLGLFIQLGVVASPWPPASQV